MIQNAPRLLIGAPSSNSGKTVFACGLLRALISREVRVTACKCGPDYIDPMFHRSVIGAQSRNIDLFFSSKDDALRLLARGARDADMTVIEGVMGYYDGIAFGSEASAWDVARCTDTPAILVVDARSRAVSVAAEASGFTRFREPSMIAGVVLNRVSASLYPALKNAIEREAGVRVYGYLPVLGDARLESRHLGLIPADEVVDLRERLDRISAVIDETIEIDALLELARSAPPIDFEERALAPVCSLDDPVRIAVAHDDAFCFYYDDALATLEELGAQLVEFSPLADSALPQGVAGLYLGGGYPELHARELSENEQMRRNLACAIADGMPTIAECGGFMYLQESLEDEYGIAWPTVGALRGRSYKTPRLQRFGYVELTAREDGLLANAGQTLRAHEFHHWDSTEPGRAFHAQKPQSARGWECAVSTSTLHAGFPHLNLYSEPRAAMRFVRACAAYRGNATVATDGATA